jgi:type I restriction enzyme R subunit
MRMNEADTRYHLIDPVLLAKRATSAATASRWRPCSRPPPVEPSGPKGRRRKSAGRTDYLLCVKIGDAPKPMPIAVLEAKKEGDDPLKGMQQARGYADTLRFDVKYVFSCNGHRYGEYDRFTEIHQRPISVQRFPAHPPT